MDLEAIERTLRDEDPDLIQHKLRTNAYVDEVRTLAEKIIVERGLKPVAPETEDEVDEKFRHNNKISLIVFALVVSYAGVLYVSNVTFLGFTIFTLALFFAVRYTLSLKKN